MEIHIIQQTCSVMEQGTELYDSGVQPHKTDRHLREVLRGRGDDFS